MKIIIAPDSFKGSISAADAAASIARGLQKQHPECSPVCVPIADGGEGALDALVPANDRFTVTVTGTNGKPVAAEYGHIGDTAVIEMARAAGLTLTPESERSALTATTVPLPPKRLRRLCHCKAISRRNSSLKQRYKRLYSLSGSQEI